MTTIYGKNVVNETPHFSYTTEGGGNGDMLRTTAHLVRTFYATKENAEEQIRNSGLIDVPVVVNGVDYGSGWYLESADSQPDSDGRVKATVNLYRPNVSPFDCSRPKYLTYEISDTIITFKWKGSVVATYDVLKARRGISLVEEIRDTKIARNISLNYDLGSDSASSSNPATPQAVFAGGAEWDKGATDRRYVVKGGITEIMSATHSLAVSSPYTAFTLLEQAPGEEWKNTFTGSFGNAIQVAAQHYSNVWIPAIDYAAKVLRNEKAHGGYVHGFTNYTRTTTPTDGTQLVIQNIAYHAGETTWGYYCKTPVYGYFLNDAFLNAEQETGEVIPHWDLSPNAAALVVNGHTIFSCP